MKKTSMLVPFSKIVIDEEVVSNPRSNAAEGIKDLAKNIATQGLLTPVWVTPGDEDTFVLISGFRRYAAISALKADKVKFDYKNIPVQVFTEGSRGEYQAINLIENLQREDLLPYQKCNGIKQLSDLGMKQQAIATALGLTQAYISMQLKIAKGLAPSAWNEFASGNLTVSDAVQMAALPKEEQEQRIGAFEEVMEGVDDVEVDAPEGSRKARVAKAKIKNTAKKAARGAALPQGEKPKFVITAKKAKGMLESIQKTGITPNMTKKSYTDGIIAVLKGLLGIEEFPFQYVEETPKKAAKKTDGNDGETAGEETPKKKPGRPKKVVAPPVEEEEEEYEVEEIEEEEEEEEIDLGIFEDEDEVEDEIEDEIEDEDEDEAEDEDEDEVEDDEEEEEEEDIDLFDDEDEDEDD